MISGVGYLTVLSLSLSPPIPLSPSLCVNIKVWTLPLLVHKEQTLLARLAAELLGVATGQGVTFCAVLHRCEASGCGVGQVTISDVSKI